MQQFELLRRQFHRHSGHAREVASWPIEAADKSKLDWVAPYSENDRDIRGHGFSSVRSRGAARQRNHPHVPIDQIGHQRVQSLVLAFGPAEFDCYVLALDIATSFRP